MSATTELGSPEPSERTHDISDHEKREIETSTEKTVDPPKTPSSPWTPRKVIGVVAEGGQVVDPEGHHVGSIILQPDESGQSPDLSGKLITSTITDPQDEEGVGGNLTGSPRNKDDSEKGWDVLGKATTAYQLWNAYQMPITHGLTFAAKLYQGDSPKSSQVATSSPESAKSASPGTIRNVLGKATSAYSIVDGYRIPAQQAMGLVERYRQPKKEKDEDQPGRQTQDESVQQNPDEASVKDDSHNDGPGEHENTTPGSQTASRVEGLDDPFTDQPPKSTENMADDVEEAPKRESLETHSTELVDDTGNQVATFAGHADPTNAEFRIEDVENVMEDEESKAGSTAHIDSTSPLSPQSPKAHVVPEADEVVATTEEHTEPTTASKAVHGEVADDSKSPTDDLTNTRAEHTEQQSGTDDIQQTESKVTNSPATPKQDRKETDADTVTKYSPTQKPVHLTGVDHPEDSTTEVRDDVQSSTKAAVQDNDSKFEPSAGAEHDENNLNPQPEPDTLSEVPDKPSANPVEDIADRKDSGEQASDVQEHHHGQLKESAAAEMADTTEKDSKSAPTPVAKEASPTVETNRGQTSEIGQEQENYDDKPLSHDEHEISNEDIETCLSGPEHDSQEIQGDTEELNKTGPEIGIHRTNEASQQATQGNELKSSAEQDGEGSSSMDLSNDKAKLKANEPKDREPEVDNISTKPVSSLEQIEDKMPGDNMTQDNGSTGGYVISTELGAGEPNLAQLSPKSNKTEISGNEEDKNKASSGNTVGATNALDSDQVAVDTTSGKKRKTDPNPDDEKLAKEISTTVDQSMKDLDPILNQITQKVNEAEKMPKNKRDEKKLVDEVQPLIEQGNKILKETNSKIRSMDPDGRIQKNAKLTAHAGVATEAETFLANQLSNLSGSVTGVIENAKKKVESMPYAKAKLQPMWAWLLEPLVEIVAAVGLLLTGVLGIVGRLLKGLGLGFIVDRVAEVLHLSDIVSYLGFSFLS